MNPNRSNRNNNQHNFNIGESEMNGIQYYNQMENSTKFENVGGSADNRLLFKCGKCKRQANSEADKKTFKVCSGCYKTQYCNRECQLADRNFHKIACKPAKANHLASIISNPKGDIIKVLSYCANGDFKGLQAEILRGVNLSETSHGQIFKAFCNVMKSQSLECAELLLQNNANPNVEVPVGGTPLFTACAIDREDFVSLLLRYNANPNFVLKKNIIVEIDCDMSPLLAVCLKGNDKCAALLLHHGADPNMPDDSGYSPLFYACRGGYVKCLSLLLHSGGNIEHNCERGFTPFLEACFRGHLKCAAILVEHGANIHKQSGEFSALSLSCMSRNVNLVTYILSLGLDPNITGVKVGWSLQYCRTFGLDKCAEVLIEHGADESLLPTNLSPTLKSLNSFHSMNCQTNKGRQTAKYCDYPDCCNEGYGSQPLHACSSCRAVYYCGREHQEAHWKEHKKLCKAIKK